MKEESNFIGVIAVWPTQKFAKNFRFQSHQITITEQASIEIRKFLTKKSKVGNTDFVQCNRTRIAIATTASKAGCNGGADFGLYTKFLEVL